METLSMRPYHNCLRHAERMMTPATHEEDRSPPRPENRGFRRNYLNFFGNPLTPNSSKFEISPKFCEAFFNPVKFTKNSRKMMKFGGKNCKNKNEKLTNI